jgi:hypothetical protein
LDVHLGQRKDQRLLAPLIAGEERRLKTPCAVPWNPELDLTHARRELPAPIAITHIATLLGPFEPLSAHELREFALDRFLNQGREHGAQHIAARGS